jgi:hypothetical protein
LGTTLLFAKAGGCAGLLCALSTTWPQAVVALNSAAPISTAR